MAGVGVLIQLMAKGKQDMMLVANPQITFWRYRHMKYTDFALEHVQVTNGTSNYGISDGAELTFDLPRSGDLVNDAFACFHLPGLANVCKSGASANVTPAAGNYCTTAAATGIITAAAGAAADVVITGMSKADKKAAPRFDAGNTGVDTDETTFLSSYGMAAGSATIVSDGQADKRFVYPGAKIGAHTWVQAESGPDPFNLETYWDPEDRCMRPNGTAAGATKDAREMDASYAACYAGRTPAETVIYNTTGADLTVPTNKNFELVEDVDERKRYHLAAAKQGLQALTLPGPQPYWVQSVGQFLMKEVKLKVGSQFVDHLYNHYLYMWDELSNKPGRSAHDAGTAYGEMMMKGTPKQRKCWSKTARTVYVPIPMFFMRTSGNALPLIALQFHGVQVVVNTENIANCIHNCSLQNAEANGFNSDNLWTENNGMNPGQRNKIHSDLFPTKFKTVVREAASSNGDQKHLENECHALFTTTTAPSAATEIKSTDIKLTLNVGYVYLGVKERNKFADASFEILIDQVQDNTSHQITSNTEDITQLSINHCVQELLWSVTRSCGYRREPFDYTGIADSVTGVARDSIKSIQLRLNNSTRFNQLNGTEVPGNYFRLVEPYLHHSRVPKNHVYSYSFALNPESEQPSGAVNMSRIDRAAIKLKMAGSLGIADSGAAKTKPESASRAALESGEAQTIAQLQNKNIQFRLYARNWNIFRITLGLGGVKWAS